MDTQRTSRIHSIDILRGLIMIIMALDHTRDFFHETAMTADPLDPAHPALYFTRWITHFCAPAFVFLSGVSAYLSSLKKSKNEAFRFLLTRGLWLVLVDITIMTFGITFNPFFNMIMLNVIWAIGWSMVVLALLSRISPRIVLITGLLLFFGHNIFDYVALPKTGVSGILSTVFFRASGSIFQVNSNLVIADLYAILPWTGVMLLGYSIGHWFTSGITRDTRKKWLVTAGLALIALFIILRSTNVYGNPTPFVQGNDILQSLFSFLNTSKYPPSLLYFCMTLGPAALALAAFENTRGSWAEKVMVYGRVPFFYYIVHFYLIHVLCVIVFFATGHTTTEISVQGFPFWFRPVNFGYGLVVTYLVWIGVVLLLYLPCRWFSRYKKTHKQWWLSYV